MRIGMSGCRESPGSGTTNKNPCGHQHLFCWAWNLLTWILLARLGKLQICGIWILQWWEGNYFGTLVLQWSWYLTFNTSVNERFLRKLYGTPVKRKLKHLLVEVSIGPGMLGSISWMLALVLLQILPVETKSEWCSVKWSLQALIWMILHVFSQFTRLSDTKLLRLTILFPWTARLYNILICQCFNYRVAFTKGN